MMLWQRSESLKEGKNMQKPLGAKKNREAHDSRLHGMTLEQWKILYWIFSRFQNELLWVKLFGSRARGDYKETSDVDLAIASKEDIRTPMQAALDESQLPYTFDLIDYTNQSNKKLQESIDREGIVLWKTNQEGSPIMAKEQITLKWEEYHKALGRLKIALQKEPDADGIYLDATIQRFEFTFELGWKLLKTILDFEGVEVASPRSAIREAWKMHLIRDAEKWLDMQQKRNLTGHTYNESTAKEIYGMIKNEYIGLLEALDQEMEGKEL